MRLPRPAARAVAIVVALVAAGTTPIALPGQVPRQPVAEPLAEEHPRAAELAALRSEIGELEARLGSMRRRQSSLEDELRSVELELELQEARLREATAAVELATSRAADAGRRIAGLEGALAEVEEDLRRRLAGLYRLGGNGYLRLFLSLRPDGEVLPAIRQLRFLARRDRSTLERYRALRDDLLDQQERRAAELEEMAAWRRREEERRDSLAAVRRRRAQLLAAFEREQQQLEARTEALLDKERKLTRLIASLVDAEAEPLGGTPIQEFRGVLDWPADGTVTVEFGPRRDPRYRTEVPHNGLSLATAAGAAVRVVYPGEVLYSAELEGYGPMVVVHHAGGVFSLYAGLSRLEVSTGDVLPLGVVVGRASSALYFEIRDDDQPRDPREWLR